MRSEGFGEVVYVVMSVGGADEIGGGSGRSHLHGAQLRLKPRRTCGGEEPSAHEAIGSDDDESSEGPPAAAKATAMGSSWTLVRRFCQHGLQT